MFDEEESSLGPAAIVALVALAVFAIGAGWYFGRDLLPGDDPEEPAEPAAVAEEESEGPRHPLPSPELEADEPAEPEPLPALDESDAEFETRMADVLGSGIAELLVDETIIRNFVATIDNLPRRNVAERIRPVGRLDEAMLVDGQDDSGEMTMARSSYDRYTPYVTLLARSDRDELVALYRRFYPLFQEAYVGLGYPDGYFNDRVVEVIDHLLETPEVDGPVRLLRPNVLYEHADPDLEALSAGQKLLLRAGPDNGVQLRQFLEEIRERIVEASSGDGGPDEPE